MECWLVGGAVRDELLGLPVHERDWVVVGSDPGALEAQGFRRVGRDFPVFLHPRTGEEYALARTERKQGHGYRGFVVHASPDVTLEQDLHRRDLTINAIARSPEGELFDPCGGLADLEARLLRHVSPAFVEDPLRVLRVARFAAALVDREFRVAEETRQLMREMVAGGELDHLVPERVWRETARALEGPAPQTYFDVLADCGALPVLFPELATQWGEDTIARRALVSAVTVDERIDVRFAAMCYRLDPDNDLATMQTRLPLPNDVVQVAGRLMRWYERLTAAGTADAEELRAIQRGLDRDRREDLYERVVRAWEAVAMAQDIAVEPIVERLALAARCVDRVRGADLSSEGWQGEALGRELERRRVAAIRAAISPDPGRRC